MKKIFLVVSVFAAATFFAQAPMVPSSAAIQPYSPLLYLQRNESIGGYIQGIQSQFLDKTNTWFFGNPATDLWSVSKGDYQKHHFTVASTGNVGIDMNDYTDKDIRGSK